MSNIFKHIGLICLMCFSFYLTDKTALVVKNNDDIMIKINEEYKKYEKEAKDAKIIENTIVPGICSIKVNKEKTYYEMSKIGKYNPNLYVLDFERPKISISTNKDKYIINDNNQFKKIYFFISLSHDNYKEIISNNYMNYNFYTTYDFIMNNKEAIEKILSNNNSVLITNTSFDNLKKVNNEYKKISNKNISCYFESENNKFLNNCNLINSNSILVSNIFNNNYLLKLKENLKNGLFISVSYNTFKKEKIVVEKYIKSKGYKLSLIDSNIEEC